MRRSARRAWRSHGPRGEINVTPLVDVTLVLLIVFMVVTPMLQRGKPVDLPRAGTASRLTSGGDPILLSITADGRYWLGESPIAKDELAEALTAAMKARPGASVVVKGDRSLDYRVVREAVREMARARITGVSLAAIQEPTSGGRP